MMYVNNHDFSPLTEESVTEDYSKEKNDSSLEDLKNKEYLMTPPCMRYFVRTAPINIVPGNKVLNLGNIIEF